MASRSPPMEPRRFASPALKALMSQRAAEFGGLLLGLVGLAVLAGPAGAILADFLLQGFGVVAILPGVAMVAWCWRIASRRGLGSFGLRLAALLAALPVLAAVFSTLPVSRAAPWPVLAGLGGSIGQIVAAAGLGAGYSLFGIVGEASIWLLAAALAGVLGLMSLGLSRAEWRSAGGAAALAARYSVSGGRNAV